MKNKRKLLVLVGIVPLLMANSPMPELTDFEYFSYTLEQDEYTCENNILSFELTNETDYFFTSLEYRNDDYSFSTFYPLLEDGFIVPPNEKAKINVELEEPITFEDKLYLEVRGEDFDFDNESTLTINTIKSTYDKTNNLSTVSINFDLYRGQTNMIYGAIFYYKDSSEQTFNATQIRNIDNPRPKNTKNYDFSFEIKGDTTKISASDLKNEIIIMNSYYSDMFGYSDILLIVLPAILIGILIFVVVLIVVLIIIYRYKSQIKKS